MTMPPNPFDALSPLEKALVETLQGMHRDVIKELRIFRWQTIALIVFLIGIVAILKGVDPTVAAKIVPIVAMPHVPVQEPMP
jgi:hypothetical protein